MFPLGILNIAGLGHNCQSRSPVFKTIDVSLLPIEPFIILRAIKWQRETPENLAFKLIYPLSGFAALR